MKRTLTTILAAGVALPAALAGGLAWAGNDKNDQAEVQLFLKAPHDISAAITAAEASAGGKAISAEFDEKKGAGRYEIDAVAGDKLVEIKVDATTGKVTDTKDRGALTDQDDDDYVDPAKLGAPLAELVATAEKESGGKVMAIGLEHEDGKMAGVEVEIAMADGTVHDFLIDAASGKLTPQTDQHEDEGE